jgi:DNA polymerase elongation subunit (family B)
MYTPNDLSKMVFFDFETASTFASLNDLNDANPKMAELWSKRCEYLRSRFEENKDKTDEELYLEKAALTAEFGRIVCATFGRISFIGSTPQLIVKSYASSNESEILTGVEKVFEKFAALKFVGHNIKRFDIPYACKRLIMNGYSLPKGLQISNLKPWEMPFIDTSEVWSFGAWQEGFASLDLLSTSLGLSSPKEDLHGSEVGEAFWEKGEIDRIAKYCEQDVLATANILLKLSNLELVEDYETQA